MVDVRQQDIIRAPVNPPPPADDPGDTPPPRRRVVIPVTTPQPAENPDAGRPSTSAPLRDPSQFTLAAGFAGGGRRTELLQESVGIRTESSIPPFVENPSVVGGLFAGMEVAGAVPALPLPRAGAVARLIPGRQTSINAFRALRNRFRRGDNEAMTRAGELIRERNQRAIDAGIDETEVVSSVSDELSAAGFTSRDIDVVYTEQNRTPLRRPGDFDPGMTRATAQREMPFDTEDFLDAGATRQEFDEVTETAFDVGDFAGRPQTGRQARPVSEDIIDGPTAPRSNERIGTNRPDAPDAPDESDDIFGSGVSDDVNQPRDPFWR